jgi:alpha-amylase
MPVYSSLSNHGYDVTEYFRVNPDYGDVGDRQELVEAAHSRQMRIILYFVLSHVSSKYTFFLDAFANPASMYSDWLVLMNEAHTT